MTSRAVIIISTLVLIPASYIAFNPEIGQYLSQLLWELFSKYISENEVGSSTSKLFTGTELEKFNGIDHPEIYLAILGKVFDVTKGAKHYGPGKQYNIFVGRDSSRSFVTGQFCSEEASDQIDNFNNNDLKALKDWISFYEKEYTEVGKLIGTYYDESGKITKYHEHVLKLFEDAKRSSDADDEKYKKYPSCNVEWSVDSGTRFWCTNRSGGIARSWVGVPRQLYEAGSKNFRCVCIDSKTNNQDTANIKEYPDCPRDSESCYVPE